MSEKIRFIVKYQVYYYNTGAGIPYGYFWKKKKFKTEPEAVEFCEKIKIASVEKSEFHQWGCELLETNDAFLTGECKMKKRVTTV